MYRFTKLNLYIPRLDTIGIAGFSHDFRTLYGEPAETKIAFDSLADITLTIVDRLKLMLSEALPIVASIPTNRSSLAERIGDSLKDVATKLLADSEEVGDQKSEDKSIIGILGSFPAHILRFAGLFMLVI
jgi:hypothetical protein